MVHAPIILGTFFKMQEMQLFTIASGLDLARRSYGRTQLIDNYNAIQRTGDRQLDPIVNIRWET